MHALPALCLCLCLAWGAGAVAAPPAHEHAHVQPAANATSILHASDAPLRAGMLRIRELLAAPRPQEADAARGLADAIDAQVQQLFAQCKLEPDADAALHGVLALLLEGAAGLRADADDDAAWAKLQQALVLYSQRFDDPGFAP